MEASLEEKVQSEISTIFQTRDFPIYHALFYSVNLVRGMERYLRSLPLDKKVMQNIHLPDIFEINDFTLSHIKEHVNNRDELVLEAKIKGSYLLGTIARVIVSNPENYINKKLTEESTRKIMLKYENLAWSIYKSLENKYGLIMNIGKYRHLMPAEPELN